MSRVIANEGSGAVERRDRADELRVAGTGVASSVARPSVLLITGALDCGGAQRAMSDMAEYWSRREWNVSLATWSGPEVRDFYPPAPGVRRVWLDVPASRLGSWSDSLARVRKLRQWLRAAKPDAILSFIDVSNIHAIVAAYGLGVRVVVAERTDPGRNHGVRLPWKILRRALYSRANVVIAQTRDAARWLDSKCGVRTVVIPNSLRALPTLECCRENLIVAVGRLSEEKGFDLLLNAFANVTKAFPQWRLCIVGEGPQRAALTLLRERLGLADQVELVGQQSNVEAWMARAGLMVHPSRREGFPNAVLEAMGMGVAVICADCRSGPSELIQEGVNGRLVPVDDVRRLADVMAEMMASPQLRESLGREASRVRERYAQAGIMQRWEECLLPEPPGRHD